MTISYIAAMHGYLRIIHPSYTSVAGIPDIQSIDGYIFFCNINNSCYLRALNSIYVRDVSVEIKVYRIVLPCPFIIGVQIIYIRIIECYSIAPGNTIIDNIKYGTPVS